MTDTQERITEIDEYLDREVGAQYQDNFLAQHWGRIAKIGEEYGEVIDALIGITGQNPRKGTYGSWEKLEKELFDTAATALLAREHLFKDDETFERFIDHILFLRKRINENGRNHPG